MRPRAGRENGRGSGRLFEDARKGLFDGVVFWSLDRFSREGVLPTLQRLEQLSSYGVDWISYSEQYLDSTGPFKDAVVSIMATLAKQERVRLSERTKAGLERASRAGQASGPPAQGLRPQEGRRATAQGPLAGCDRQEGWDQQDACPEGGAGRRSAVTASRTV